MRYRFEPEDFAEVTIDYEGQDACLTKSETEEIAKLANTKLAEWEKESQKLYGAPNPKTGEIQIWTAKGPAKLLRQDYTHVACVWNPRKFEEVK